MELRDPVHGTLSVSNAETQVLDSAPYQRLRAIKQLGFSEFSFPGATHNRYIHSVGVSHLSGIAFDSVFKEHQFSKPEVGRRLRQTLRLGTLLHDIGHGPLSHTTEEVMPLLKSLNLKAYEKRRSDRGFSPIDMSRQADHEDYTIKFLTDSSLTPILKSNFSDIDPIHIACLIDKSLECPDDFFIDSGVDYRTILSQIVSSEMDVDRMDYLERDAYFCGTNYGRVELSWLLANLRSFVKEGEVHLALNRRALYTFDDFLLSRHHMHLMVYFHHKAIIYEEMLYRYLTSEDCEFRLPEDIEEYIHYTDYALHQNIGAAANPWAQRIAKRQPYKMLFELHSNDETGRPDAMRKRLEDCGVDAILASSQARLSKYHTASPVEKSFPIFVVDDYDLRAKAFPIEESTEIFDKYEKIRRIDRLYVAPELYAKSKKIIVDERL